MPVGEPDLWNQIKPKITVKQAFHRFELGCRVRVPQVNTPREIGGSAEGRSCAEVRRWRGPMGECREDRCDHIERSEDGKALPLSVDEHNQ